MLSNAAKFTPSSGTIRVSIQREAGATVIEVADTGVGIAPEAIKTLFTPFGQVENANRRSHGGLGLGLSIARDLVELHGGSIHAQSQGVGRGTKFSIVVPALHQPIKAEPAPQEVTDPGPDALRGKRILLVEDDEPNLLALQAALTSLGARVTAVPDASKALEAVMVARYDVLVGDIDLPGHDGNWLIEQLRTNPTYADARGLPAVAVTALARPADRQAARAAGFQGFISKPVNLEKLVAAIAAAMRDG